MELSKEFDTVFTPLLIHHSPVSHQNIDTSSHLSSNHIYGSKSFNLPQFPQDTQNVIDNANSLPQQICGTNTQNIIAGPSNQSCEIKTSISDFLIPSNDKAHASVSSTNASFAISKSADVGNQPANLEDATGMPTFPQIETTSSDIWKLTSLQNSQIDGRVNGDIVDSGDKLSVTTSAEVLCNLKEETDKDGTSNQNLELNKKGFVKPLTRSRKKMISNRANACKTKILKSHMAAHQKGLKPEVCDTCGKTFKSNKRLQNHIQKFHGENSSKGQDCPICGKNCKTKPALETHILKHTGEKPHSCTICNKTFISKGNLSLHILSHSNNTSKKCETCGRICKSQSALKIHVMIHTGERPHVCTTCGKGFSTPGKLSLHAVIHSTDRNHLCNTCGKSFKLKSSLRIHMMLTHSQEKGHSCDICGKSYHLAAFLRQHQRTHSGDRRFKCQICNKTFLAASHLRQHQRTHTQERPFKCTECEKSFIMASHLKDHKRVHTGEKPFECTICCKKYPHASSLRKHLRKGHLHLANNSTIGAQDVNTMKTEVQGGFLKQNILPRPDLTNRTDLNEKQNILVRPDGIVKQDALGNIADLWNDERRICIICRQLYPPSEKMGRLPIPNSRPYICTMCSKYALGATLDNQFMLDHNSGFNNQYPSILGGDGANVMQTNPNCSWNFGWYPSDNDTYTNQVNTQLQNPHIQSGQQQTSQQPLTTQNQQHHQQPQNPSQHQPQNPQQFAEKTETNDTFLQEADSQVRCNPSPTALISGQGIDNNDNDIDDNHDDGENISNHSESEIEDDEHEAERKKIKEEKDKLEIDCQNCGISFRTDMALDKHLKVKLESKEKKCPISNCFVEFKTKCERRKHLSSQHIENIFLCPICEKDFEKEKLLHRHLKTHLGEKEKSHLCFVCGKTYKGSVRSHMQSHSNERSFICPICGKKLKRKGNLKQHMRLHKFGKSGETPFECSICNKKFKCKEYLRFHVKYHHAMEKPHACETCGKGFPTMAFLRQHQRIHSEERPYKCSVCNKGFIAESHLRQHQRSHTQERPFSCGVCFKAFLMASHLKEHERIHNGERLECSLCGRKYTSASTLKRHLAKGHGHTSPAKAASACKLTRVDPSSTSSSRKKTVLQTPQIPAHTTSPTPSVQQPLTQPKLQLPPIAQASAHQNLVSVSSSALIPPINIDSHSHISSNIPVPQDMWQTNAASLGHATHSHPWNHHPQSLHDPLQPPKVNMPHLHPQGAPNSYIFL